MLAWLKQNLFSTWYNTLLTLLCLWLLWQLVPPLLQWALLDADFSAAPVAKTALPAAPAGCSSRRASGSSCTASTRSIERWRVNLAFVILIVALIPLFLPRFRHKLALAAGILVLYPIVAYCLFYGGVFGLPVVETALWGGLFLTLVIAGVGIVASLPLGILFALGRRSDMPIVRAVCITFIEVMRGVPLITILFMASVMLPLFLPQGVNFDKLLRALVGVALFSAAYMAEVVRGGLQAIPKGPV